MTLPRADGRTPRRRRRRAVVIGAVIAVLVVAGTVVAFARTGADDGSGAHRAAAAPTPASTTHTTPTTSLAPPTTAAPTTTAPVDVDRVAAVGTRTLTFVDPSRPTSANGDFGGAPTRTLPTEFWYPAEGAGGGSPQPDAAPDRTHGPYPLVVFSHGYNVTPDFYAPLLERWAAAGFVVAAPVYPILSGSPGGASHVDYEQTFADTSFVITQVEGLGSGELLAGIVDPNRVAAAGHSDGEVISFGVGFLECCRDPRVKSVIAMAGDLANANNPSVRDTGTPILHIMETNDEYDPYPASIAWDRENLTAPRWMLTLFSSHVPPYTQPGVPAFELVSKVTIDYLDGTLLGRTDRLDRVTADVAAVPDVGTLER